MDTNARRPSELGTFSRTKLLEIRPELFFYSGPLERDRILRENALRNRLVSIALGGAVAILAMTYFASQHDYFAAAERQVGQQAQAAAAPLKGGKVDPALFVVADEARRN